ncbi:hypothetical protein H6775_01230 [Candidatus Nomurabacteria bacterium]|nr:hypothetical protein [Candidatus Nomurabacteria bacterium]
MDKIIELEKRVENIEQRNKKVEAEKDWETSWTRVILLVLVTYILVSLLMYFLNIADPLINSFVPTLGFFISVQSLPILKKWWINKKLKD